MFETILAMHWSPDGKDRVKSQDIFHVKEIRFRTIIHKAEGFRAERITSQDSLHQTVWEGQQ